MIAPEKKQQDIAKQNIGGEIMPMAVSMQKYIGTVFYYVRAINDLYHATNRFLRNYQIASRVKAFTFFRGRCKIEVWI